MATRRYGKASVVWTFHAGATSFPIKVKKWHIHRSRFDLLSWSVTLAPLASYLPTGEQGVHFDQCLPYDPASLATLNRWLTCSLVRGETAEPLPLLIQDDYPIEETVAGRSIELSGFCRGDVLNSEDQFMSEIRSINGAAVMACATLEEICSAYGITCDTSNYEDHPIPVLARYGTPISWIREILTARQGWFWWNGTTLVFEMGGIDIDAATSVFSIVDKGHCKVLRRRKTVAGTCNEVTVQMASEIKSGLVAPKAGKGLGFQSPVALDRPLNQCGLSYKLFGPGSITLIAWKDADDNYLTPADVTSKTYIGPTPAASVVFSVNPPEGAGPFPEDIAWEIEIHGAAHVEDFGTFDPNFAQTYIDTADQAARYRIPRHEPLIVPMAATPTIALDTGRRWSREQLRKWLTSAVDMVLEPALRPGVVIDVTCLRYGFDSTKFLVESQDMQGDDKSYTQTLEICRGPQYA